MVQTCSSNLAALPFRLLCFFSFGVFIKQGNRLCRGKRGGGAGAEGKTQQGAMVRLRKQKDVGSGALQLNTSACCSDLQSQALDKLVGDCGAVARRRGRIIEGLFVKIKCIESGEP